MIALGELVLVEVRVELRPQVDVALRALERAEELAHVLRIGIAGDHRRHHEGAVGHFAEAELLGEIIRPGKQRTGRRLALEQEVHTREQHPFLVRKVDAIERHELLERLNGRVVAARLVADRDRDAGELTG